MQIILTHYTILINMFIFLFLSAFFSGTETALFSLTRYQIAELTEEKSKISETILYLLKTPSKLLTSVLIGNMTVNILFFCFSTVLLSELGESFHNNLGKVCFSTVILLIVIIFGEILPKALAIKTPVTIARFICYPTCYWQYISTPLRIVITAISSKFEPRLNKQEKHIKAEELKMLLKLGKDDGVINQKALDMIEDIISLSNLRVKYIMTPRVDVVQCSKNETVKNCISVAKKNKLYYLPVFNKTKDNTVGLVRIKDLCLSGNVNQSIENYIITPKFVPETKIASQLLSEMIKEDVKTALVVDEFGGLAGKVTLDTILKQVVGELQHNTKRSTPPPIEKLVDGKYRVLAGISITDWEEFFNYHIKDSDTYNITSIGGFVTSLLSRLPVEGDNVQYENFSFKVEAMKNKRIKTLILTIE